MKGVFSKTVFALIFAFIPFFAEAQITGDTSVYVGALISITNANPGGVWGSDNEDVASVDRSGNVNGNAVGTATISYTYVDASFELKTDIATITVTQEPATTPALETQTTTIVYSDALICGTWKNKIIPIF